MEYLTDAFETTIRPFRFSEHNGSYSALLYAGQLYNAVFEEYYERKGIEGGGYSWDALAALYIKEQMPRHEAVLEHDSEAGMFCLYSNSEQAIYEFLKGFSEYIRDEGKFRDLMDRADFEAWD